MNPKPKNPIIKAVRTVALACLSVQTLFAGLISSTPSMRDYATGDEKLTVYADVPGHETPMMQGPTSTPYRSRAKSDIYEIWVRSAATDNEWVQCFANMTYNRGAEMPETPAHSGSTAIQGYQRHTAGWTHTYANIEMSENSPVEVEIRKIGDTLLNWSPVIIKSGVYPSHKLIPGSKKDENGRVYFKITKPGQIVIDINGQMDDHNAAFPWYVQHGAMLPQSDGKATPVHSIALYANPIMAKPVASPTNRILTIQPSQSSRTERLLQPDYLEYDTLVFAPGIHNIGSGFKVKAGRNYYIPGDAILYGSITNEGTVTSSYDWDVLGIRDRGHRIKIFGYGSINGIQTPHYARAGDTEDPVTGDFIPGQPDQLNPEYQEWNSWPEGGVNNVESIRKRSHVGVRIEKSRDMTITGVSVIDPANFNTRIDGDSGECLVSWVKLHSWRVNGDGFGGYPRLEDSFVRAGDDSTYVRNWRKRCTFWKDTNASLFRFVNAVRGGLEDCDIIYSRWRSTGGNGRHFSFEGYSVDPEPLVLKFKDLRFHDKLANPGEVIGLGNTAVTYPNLTFENISFYTPINGKASVIGGSVLKPYTGYVIFKNVTFHDPHDGSALVKLNSGNYQNYFATNEFVDPSIFEPAYTLATSAENGRIVLDPPGGAYEAGTVVTVTACPAMGYTIGNWGGDLSGAAIATTITMDGNKSISASFTSANASKQFTQTGSGTWTVPPGVNSATLHLWGGGGAGGSAHNNSVTTDFNTALGGGGTGGSYSSKTVHVTLGQVIHYTVGAGGAGSILNAGESFPPESFGSDGNASFASLDGGESFVVAQGGKGGNNVSSQLGIPRYAFESGNIGDVRYYGGDGAGTSNTSTGAGGGSAGSLGDGGDAGTNSPPGIAGLGGGAVGGVNYGGNGANPGGGGGGAGMRNSTTPGTFSKGGNGGTGQMTITYTTSFPSMTTQAVNGTISASPSGPYYPLGSTTTLTAIPNSGYKFTGWSGDLTGNINPSPVVMDGSKSITANFSILLPTEYHVNCGGPAYVALDGSYYVADNTPPGGLTTSAIANTNDDALYQSERVGKSLSYNIPLENGNYQVTMMFAETYHNAVNKRVFDVSLEGLPVITNLDIWSKVGKFAAYNETHLATVSDGQLNIACTTRIDNAKFCAIRVVPANVLSTSSLNGSVVLNPPGGVYVDGTAVTVTATPDSGYRFNNWSGAASGATASTTIIMDGSKSLTANFTQVFTLSTSAVNGNISLSPSGGTYDIGTEVTVTATPDSGYRFNNWIGATSGTASSINVVMDGDKSVTAEFSQVFTLSTIAQNGNITLSPPGGTYDVGTTVTVTATGNSGFRFNSWSGAATGTASSTTIVMDGNKSVTANFTQVFTLATSAVNGSITLSPAGGIYDLGAVVTVTAAPSSGYRFNSWSGAASGTTASTASTASTTVVMDGNKSVTAAFSPAFTLATSAVNGSITLSPAGGVYDPGVTVTVTATPDSGYRFNGWSGAASGTETTTTIVMDGNKSITANITQVFTLATTTVNGSMTLSPTGGTYDTGTTVTVTAVPNSGYEFLGWSGASSSIVSSTTVVMNANKSVRANFAISGTSLMEYRVNYGGPSYVALDGSYYAANNTPPGGSTTAAIANTNDDTLYQSERVGRLLSYNIPLQNGTYQVTLMFAETWHNAANKRVFSVSLEGTSVITDLDIWSKVGKNAAYNETHLATVSDGQLNIVCTAKTDYAKMCAIRVIPAYVLTTSSPNGSVVLNPPGGSYVDGTTVTVTAAPNSGYRFNNWSGAASGTTASTTVVMDGNKSVSADFIQLFTLAASATNGNITLSPAGGIYDAGTVVTVTATPDSGCRFIGWSGDASGTDTTTAIVMDGNKSITADFTQVFSLATSALNGNISISPAGGTYVAGTTVTVTATPDSAYRFNSWSGAASGTDISTTIVMDGNKSVTADFTQVFTLAISTVNGNITLSPAGGIYDVGTEVTVTSTPNSGFVFVGWAGSLSGRAPSVVTTMDSNKSVVATFIQDVGGTALSRTGWLASASSTGSGNSSQYALDGNIATRWATGADQVPGQWFTVDLLTPQFFHKIVLDAGSSSLDYPRGYEVHVSNDGSTWGSPVASGAGSSAVTTISFSQQTARYIKVTQTGSVEGNAWSIAELNILNGLSAPWLTADVGAVGVVGSAVCNTPLWTIKGSGADIWGGADEFRYVHQSASGDCSVVARVSSLVNTNAWAKTAVMIRESTAANSINAMVCVTPTNGISFQWRSATGGGTSNVRITGLTAPNWLKITRIGNSFTAFHSPDGITWIPVGTPKAITMSAVTAIGMAVTSHNDSVLCTSTMDNVTAIP